MFNLHGCLTCFLFAELPCVWDILARIPFAIMARSSYLHFVITEKIVHPNYVEDSYNILRNYIALLRVDKSIPFDDFLRPICLPNVNVSEPQDIRYMPISGWGITQQIVWQTSF